MRPPGSNLNPLRQNRLLTAPEAVELGIADRLLEPVEFVDESLAFAAALAVERATPDWSGSRRRAKARRRVRRCRGNGRDVARRTSRSPSSPFTRLVARGGYVAKRTQ